MSENPQNERWREDAWRPRLTSTERERLRTFAREADRADELRLERRLTAALDRLPQAPVPSNFTARVLEAAAREPKVARRPAPHFFSRWLPRLAFGCLLLGAGLFSWQRQQVSHRAALVQSVATISSASVPSPDILKDFEAIRALSTTPPADEQLLALMQ